MEQYVLSESPHLTQLVHHYLSSLQQPSLENVQASLSAIRKRNMQLSLQLRNSGSLRSDQYIKQTLDLQERKQQRRQTMIRRQTVIRSSNNPWAKPQKKETKQHRSPQESDYLRKFNNFQKEKKLRKTQERAFNKQDFQRFQCTSPNKIRNNIPNSSTYKDPCPPVFSSLQRNQTKNYQRKLIEKIFQEVATQSQDLINKADLVDYLADKEPIMNMFEFNLQSLKQEVIKFNTLNYGNFTLDQFIEFMQINRQMRSLDINQQKNLQAQIKASKMLKYVDHDEQLFKKGCLIKRTDLKILQTIFKELDIHSDFIVSRQQLVQKLKTDPKVTHLMEQPVVYEFKIGKSITFSRIIQRIEVQGHSGNEEDRKIKQFISLKQFMSNFFSYEEGADNSTQRLNKMTYLSVIQKINDSDQNVIQLPRHALEMLESAFNECPRVGPYAKTSNFVQNVKRSSEYQEMKGLLARKTSQRYKLESESMEEVLARMLQQGEQYMQFKQIFQFFSRKGRPQFYYNESNKLRSLKKEKFKEQIQKLLRIKANEEGYDSDPEYQRQQKSKTKGPARTHSQLKLGSDRVKETAVSKMVQTIGKLGQQQIMINRQFGKITIPQPFKFSSSKVLKTTSSSKRNQEKKNKNQSFQFKALPLDKTILEIGLFDKLIHQQEQRKKQVKRQSMALTLAKQRPFSFYKRANYKAKRKTKQQRVQYKFKAAPVPWFCSVSLFKKMVEEESIIRKEKISRMAQEGMTKSRLPPRMQKDQQLKKAKQLREGQDFTHQNSYTFQKIKRKEVPDFQNIHRGLIESLQRKRNSKRPTQPCPFRFEYSRINEKKQQQIQKVQVERAKSVEKVRNLMKKQPSINAGSTAKYNQQSNVNRQRRELLNQLQKLKHESPQPNPQLKQRINKSLNNVRSWEGTINQSVKRLKKQSKLRQLQYQQRRAKIMQAVQERPRLIEQKPKSKQQEQLKSLYEMYHIMCKNGLDAKYIKNVFKEEQLRKIKDYEFLLKNNMIKSK